MEVLCAPDTGLWLGAQAIGHDGVDKRIDVLRETAAARHPQPNAPLGSRTRYFCKIPTSFARLSQAARGGMMYHSS